MNCEIYTKILLVFKSLLTNTLYNESFEVSLILSVVLKCIALIYLICLFIYIYYAPQ